MNSHEYAMKLKELAEFLLGKPDFNMPWGEKHAYTILSYWGSKDDFLGAVRALGEGTKEWSRDDLTFVPSGTDMLHLQIARSKVCRKVQEEKWECEPLLSQAEEAQIGA